VRKCEEVRGYLPRAGLVSGAVVWEVAEVAVDDTDPLVSSQIPHMVPHTWGKDFRPYMIPLGDGT
jgi:hypothetical protein